MLSTFHPVTWVAAALLAGAVVSGIAGFHLLLVALGLSLAAAIHTRSALFRLLRRTRWLLFSVFVLFLWGTPGEYVRGSLSLLAITYEGLTAAVEHGLRLVAMLALVALLTEGLQGPGLVAGFARLLAPLALLGLDVERASRRLMLVLAMVEQAPAQAGWRYWLLDHPAETSHHPTPTLQVVPLHGRDGLALAAILGAGLLWWWP